jgi:hypothetical protein
MTSVLSDLGNSGDFEEKPGGGYVIDENFSNAGGIFADRAEIVEEISFIQTDGSGMAGSSPPDQARRNGHPAAQAGVTPAQASP